MGLIIKEGLGWLAVLVLVVGALVCAIYLTRVRWAAVFMAGFGLQAIWLGISRLVVFLMRHGIYAGSGFGLVLASLAGLLGSALLVAGVIGVLAQLARMQPTQR